MIIILKIISSRNIILYYDYFLRVTMNWRETDTCCCLTMTSFLYKTNAQWDSTCSRENLIITDCRWRLFLCLPLRFFTLKDNSGPLKRSDEAHAMSDFTQRRLKNNTMNRYFKANMFEKMKQPPNAYWFWTLLSLLLLLLLAVVWKTSELTLNYSVKPVAY